MNKAIEKTINDRIKKLEELIDSLERCKIPGFEGETLRITHNGKNPKYYYKSAETGDKYKYIKKSDVLTKAKLLAQKEYDNEALETAIKELDYLYSFTSSYPVCSVEDLYLALNPDRRILVYPVELPDEILAERWMAEPYNRKPFSEYDNTQYYTHAGIRVHSKSEILIADKLERNDIPFKIELPLYLKGLGWIYPDFTILDIRTRSIKIWEHHGLMDDKDYRDNNFFPKNTAYPANGYFPGVNLIQTFESQKHPLGTNTIDAIINQYLL